MKSACCSALLAISLAASTASSQTVTPQPWQQLDSPTADEVFSAWHTPPSEFGPEPYYALNGPFDLPTVRRDLDTMQSLGFRAVTVQYGFGSRYVYLSAEYLAFFRSFVQEAKKRNMRVWIVDDAGYPSGFAGGKFSTEYPELRMQALVAEQVTVKAGDTFKRDISPETVAVNAIRANDGSSLDLPMTDGKISWQAPAGSWTVYVVTHRFRTSPTRSDTNPKRSKDQSQSLEDYLDPAATAQYLKLTHEAYKAVVGDEFGKTILGFRGDEPDYSIDGLPWTPGFFEQFLILKHYDIHPYLAALLRPDSATLTARQMRARADYFDVFARLFEDGFFKPQGEWCAANHLEYQVHLNHEEMQLKLVHSEGDFFRDMHHVQVPGIDAIWHQIWTDTIADYPRLASSAAHVYGHPRAFTESFAAYRPMPDVTMARYIINEQMVRGINLVETMYLPSSSTPGQGSPPAFMLDPAYPALMLYTSRLSYLMSSGHPAASVALLLPTSSLWMDDKKADDMFVSTERLLSERQIDFDIISEDVINQTLKPVPGALETMSGNRLRTVIVPAASLISEATVLRLKTLVSEGGHVLFVGGTPARIADHTFLDARAASKEDFAWASVNTDLLEPVPTPPAQAPASPPPAQRVPADLEAALQKAISLEDVTLARSDVALRYTHRTLDAATVFLLFNESPAPLHNQLRIRSGGKAVELWDPQTGTRKAASGAVIRKGEITLPLSLDPYATAVFVVRKNKDGLH